VIEPDKKPLIRQAGSAEAFVGSTATGRVHYNLTIINVIACVNKNISNNLHEPEYHNIDFDHLVPDH